MPKNKIKRMPNFQILPLFKNEGKEILKNAGIIPTKILMLKVMLCFVTWIEEKRKKGSFKFRPAKRVVMIFLCSHSHIKKN